MNNESAAVEAVVFDRDAIFRSAEARAKLYALTLLVEGPGCIRWEDGNGFRLKDTDEWVQFYCLVKSMQNFTFRDETQSALDALRGEVAAAERRVAELENLLGAWYAEESRYGARLQAPDHHHQVPGIWDSDNGPIAGKPCAKCALWQQIRSIAGADPT